MIKISIIIPYYQKKIFIEKTLKSILKQSYKNFEVIIIYDDTDKEDLIYIKRLSKIDKRIKIIVNKNNLGAGASRNKGIMKAKGKYVSFVDADDVWKKNKLKLQLQFMERNNYLISHTSYQVVDIKNNLLEIRKARTFKYLEDLLYSCDIGLSSVMIKRDIFSKKLKFPKLKTKEDFVLWLNFIKSGFKIYSLNLNLMSWTKTKGSLSSSILQKIKDSLSVYHIYMKFNLLKSFWLTLVLSLNFLKKSTFRIK